MSVDLDWLNNNTSAVCSLLLLPELGSSRFRRPPGYVCHYREPAPHAHQSPLIHSPYIITSRNPKEWIA
jgi:hypothetical protein